MNPARRVVRTRNDRLQLTDRERALIDSLNEASIAVGEPSSRDDLLINLNRSLAHETQEALRTVIPDFDERRNAQIEHFTAQRDTLKGVGWPIAGYTRSPAPADTVIPSSGLANLTAPTLHPQPANVGEFWWAETFGTVSAPDDSITLDSVSPWNRIWGHIAYDRDELLQGDVFVTHTLIVDSARLPRTERTSFTVRPEIRHGGWVSGWTGLYHPLWHADDKWSKCWRRFEMRLMLSTGEVIAFDSLRQQVFALQNVDPVGQANINEFSGWGPVLSFTANMNDLRARGVSILLRFEFQYGFQLEGESDIWFRGDPNGEAGPDNAFRMRFIPYSIPAF
jgi:hypothetical protein